MKIEKNDFYEDFGDFITTDDVYRQRMELVSDLLV